MSNAYRIQAFGRSFCLVGLVMLPASNVLANTGWTYHQENDRLSNRSYSFARSPMPRRDLYDDLRLDVVCKDNLLQVLIDAEVLIASQGSLFDVEYQIDKQTPVKIQMRTFADSKRRGFNEAQAKQLGDALLTGQAVFLRVTTMIRRVLSGVISLNEAAEPIKRVYADCGLNVDHAVQSGYSLSQFNEDFKRLSDEQQRQVLDKVQHLMSHLP